MVFQIMSGSSLLTLPEFSPSSDRAPEISESRPSIDPAVRGGRRALYQRASQPDVNVFRTSVVSFYLKILKYFLRYPATFPPPPSCIAAEPSPIWKRTLIWLNNHTYYMLKSKGKTCMVKEPSHVKQLSLNHLCKIGLKLFSSSVPTRLFFFCWIPGFSCLLSAIRRQS